MLADDCASSDESTTHPEGGKLKRRRMQNRKAAQVSREKKKRYLADLETQVKALLVANQRLESSIEELKSENVMLHQKNNQLTAKQAREHQQQQPVTHVPSFVDCPAPEPLLPARFPLQQTLSVVISAHLPLLDNENTLESAELNPSQQSKVFSLIQKRVTVGQISMFFLTLVILAAAFSMTNRSPTKISFHLRLSPTRVSPSGAFERDTEEQQTIADTRRRKRKPVEPSENPWPPHSCSSSTVVHKCARF
jgi:hypothetical protein